VIKEYPGKFDIILALWMPFRLSSINLYDNIEQILAVFKMVISLRGEIYANPGLRFEGYKTTRLIASSLEELGIEVIESIAETRIFGILRGEKERLVSIVC